MSMFTLTRVFPGAFAAGLSACRLHYSTPGPEHPLPGNPHPKPPRCSDATEWHAWNSGWNSHYPLGGSPRLTPTREGGSR